MTASSQTHDPTMDTLLHGMPEETIRLALKMAQLMEGRSKEDRQALLNSFKNPELQSNRNTDISLQSPCESGTNGGFQELPGKDRVTLEATGKGGDGMLQSDIDTVIAMETASKAIDQQVEANGMPNTSDVVKTEEQDAGMVEKSTELQSETESSTAEKQEGNNDQFFSCEDHTKMSATSVSSETENDDDKNSTNNQMTSVKYREKDFTDESFESQTKTNLHEGVGIDEDKENEGSQVYAMVSSDDDLPPSTPASGRRSSGSELSESLSEETMHAAHNIAGDSTSAGGMKDVPGTSPVITVTPDTHQANYKVFSPSTLPANQKSFDSTLTEQAFQTSCSDKTPTISGRPKAPDMSQVGATVSGLHQEGQYEEQISTKPGFQKSYSDKTPTISGRPKAPGMSQVGATVSGLHQEGQYEEQISTKPGFQKSYSDKTPTISGRPKAPGMSQVGVTVSGLHQEGQYEEFPSLPTWQQEPTPPQGSTSSTFQHAAKPPKKEQEKTFTVTSSDTPLQTTSTLITAQGTTNSLLSAAYTLPIAPLYYQPHIIIQDNLPVLMLRPVLGPNISSELKESIDLGGSSMVFPLVGGQAMESRMQMNNDNLSSDAESRDSLQNMDSQDLGTQLLCGNAYSTESDMEERALSEHAIKHRDQDEWSGGRGVTAHEENTWTSQPRNPFLNGNGTGTTYSYPTSRTPSYNFGYPVSSSMHQAGSFPSSNPFSADEPQRTYKEDDLFRTDFSTIPKSMLAGQVPPRGPPVNQISGNAMPSRGSTMSWVGAGTTPLRQPPVSQTNSNPTPSRGLPVSSQICGTNIQPPRELPVSSQICGNIQPPRGLPEGQAAVNTTPARVPHVNHIGGNATQPRGTPVSQVGGDGMPSRRRMSSGSMITLLEVSDNQNAAVPSQAGNYNPVLTSVDPSLSPATSNFAVVTSSVAPSNNGVTTERFAEGRVEVMGANTQRDTQPQPVTNPKTPLPGHVAPYWVPDDEVFKCAYCHLKFNMFRRKHHCRGCGKIFCSDCCSQLARLSYLQYQIERICIRCTNDIKEEIRKRKKNVRPQSRQSNVPRRDITFRNEVARAPIAAAPVTSHSQPMPLATARNEQPPQVMSAPTFSHPSSSTHPEALSHFSYSQSGMPSQAQLVYIPSNFQPETGMYTGPTPRVVEDAPLVYPSTGLLSGQAVDNSGWQAGGGSQQYNPVQSPSQVLGTSSTARPLKVAQHPAVAMVMPSGQIGSLVGTVTSHPEGVTMISQSDRSAFHSPRQDETHQNVGYQKQNHSSPDSSQKITDYSDFKVPLRPAGRIVSWKGESFASRLLAQDRRKALAKDLRDLPHGVTMQLSEELQIVVKRIKVQSNPPRHAWCCFSDGLRSFNQQEIAMLFLIRPKEDVVPEEILRMYKVILDLVKLGNIFQHSNFLAFNSPFLGTPDNAAFIFAKDSLVEKLKALGERKSNFLYGILVKRSELEYAKHTPMRFLLRLGQENKRFPFPVVNSRDRAIVYDGVDLDDLIYSTSVNLNNHLIVNFFDRLIVKTNHTATIPLVSDLSTNVDQYRVYHQSIHTNEIALRKHMSSFRNPNNPSHCGIYSVTGLGFLILLLGASDSPVLEQRGTLLDDGALVHLTDVQTSKLRQSLRDRSNCNFYLGDQFEILYFELRWIQGPLDTPNNDDCNSKSYPVTQEPHSESYPGSATVDVRHSGHTSELKKLANARLGDVLILIRLFEQRIKRACLEPLMMQTNRMRAGESKELILRLSLRDGYKKWSIGPSNQPMGLIRSLQMALYEIKVSDLQNACLELSFDVTIIKQ